MPLKTPSYRKHTSGQAMVRINVNGQRRVFYLGKYGSPRSKERYQQVLAEYWRPSHAKRPTEWPTIEELMAAYVRHCEVYYRDSNETEHVILALRPLRKLFGEEDTCDFGPKKLKAVRQEMIDAGRLTRSGINKRITRLRRMFKWGVSEEMVPARVYQELVTLPSLSRGRSPAPEAPQIESAADHDVDAALAHMTAPIAAMVELQRLTGMRPGEVIIMRRRDIDTSGPVWVYSPAKHKNQWREQSRRVMIGPRAQQILLAWLPAEYDAYVFSPRRHFGNARFRDHYDVRQYRKSIYAACDAACVARWAPNQLRHAAAERAQSTFGSLEASSAMLDNTVTAAQIYAKKNRDLARVVAERIG